MYGREYGLDDIQIGSQIIVNIAGERFALTVDAVEEDVKNDRPGGDGHTADGDERWFYCEQIERVIKK